MGELARERRRVQKPDGPTAEGGVPRRASCSKLSGAEAKTRDARRFASFPAEQPASVDASYHAIALISRAIDKGMALTVAAIVEMTI
jgi:hypothetical protein